MNSRIEQIISEIEDYIDGCRFQPLSKTNIVVNKDEIEELLAELRLKTPDEIKKYQKIIANRDAILLDAKQKADAMLQDAVQQTNALVSEHEIMQQAYVQANEVVQKATNQAQAILDNATNDANNIRMGAMQYTDDILGNLQNIITHSMENITNKYNDYMKALQTSLDVVVANRNELNPPEEPDMENIAANADSSVEGLSDNDDFEDYTVQLDM
ncbi:MAG: ATPase [Lachnospiraceae bacterium]|nr:ATPase [Lachnospiraceae bacterium]